MKPWLIIVLIFYGTWLVVFASVLIIDNILLKRKYRKYEKTEH